MNTGKQINAMVAILFVALIALGAYAIWDPERSDTAESDQEELALERGAHTFALNCRLCHGDRGQGGADGGRLAAALPLNGTRLQGLDDLTLDDALDFVTNTITCGRVGKQMPTWGIDQGGTLNHEQIRQLSLLITSGHWELVQEQADEIDAETTNHATVDQPDGEFNADEAELIVSDAGAFTAGQYIRIKLPEAEGPTEEPTATPEGTPGASTATPRPAPEQGPGEERMRILPKQLVVARGVLGSEAALHERGALVRDLGLPPEEREEAAQSLLEAMTEEDSLSVVVSDTNDFAPGDMLRVDDEVVRVEEIVTGVPATGQALAEEIGRNPDSFLVSGARGIEIDAIVRIGSELMRVEAVSGDADAGVELDAATDASSETISVDDPTFFRPDYVVRAGDELIRVVEAVDTERTLGDTIGRAETSFTVSGSSGLSEGMVIRIDGELMEITDLQPAHLQVERGVTDEENNESEPAPHPADAAILTRPDPAAAEEPTEEDLATGETLLEGVNSDATDFVVTGTEGIVQGELYQLGDELVQVTGVVPALVRVERGAGGTDKAAHARRSSIFDGNLLEVERGFDDTTPAAHSDGDTLFFTEVKVERAVAGSKLEPHSKAAELFIGNGLIVERGVSGTDPAGHENGVLVLDYPQAPDNPPRVEETCGQIAPQPSATPSGPTPTVGATPEGTPVAVSLTEFAIAADPASVATGPVNLSVSNDGTIIHNLRVIATELAPDALPQDAGIVDEGQLDVIASISDFAAGSTQTAFAELPAGSYVLICNFPGHYLAQMYTGFEVTP